MGCCAMQKAVNSIIVQVDSTEKPVQDTYHPVHLNHKRFLDQYKVEQSLGSGSYGEVRKVIHKLTGQERAVKIFLKTASDIKSYLKVKSEIEILSSLSHPSIIRIFEYFEDEKRLYIILEKCNGGELFDMITSQKFLNEKVSAIIIKQIFSAVLYMHEKKVVHRDMKPENILLEEAEDYVNIKIIDFGAAVKYAKNPLSEIIGSPFYLSPEVIASSYGPECDLWSCGVILYILLSGYPPFDGKNNTEIFNKIQNLKYDFENPVWSAVSDPAKDLIRQLLQPSSCRITIRQALDHPWIQSQSVSLSPNAPIIDSLKENLKNFQTRNKLHKAITSFITNQIITREETKQLREIFKALDLNGDGQLSKEELLKGLTENGEIVVKIMEKVDADKNGFIDLDEFLIAAVSERFILTKENLKSAFDMFDLDGSGKISFDELKEVLGVGFSAGKGIWDDIMTVKVNKEDNEVTFEEFSEIILKKIDKD